MNARVLPGILLALFWVLLLLYGSAALFLFVITAILFLAADEYVRMMRGRTEGTFVRRMPLGLTLLLPLGVMFFPSFQHESLTGLVFFAFLLLSCWHITQFAKEGAGNAQADYLRYVKDVFGLLYVGGLGAHFCMLRMAPDGANWILVATAITASSDTGAYFSGRHFGRHKLCSTVSPKKTMEGALGGILSAVIGALVAGYALFDTLPLFFLIGSSIALSLLGIVGDLVESVIKRGVGVKDSGSCLAGHGGILDRLDSLLFALPALYYFLLFSDFL